MKKIAIALLGLSGSLASLHAQQSYTYELEKYATKASSYDDIRTDTRTDIENTFVYQVRHHSALFDWLVNGLSADYSFLKRNEKGLVSVTMDLRNNQGENLFYNGKDRIAGEVLAGSHFTLKNKGTLFGMASYQQRKIEDMRFNYSTHPEDYVPYLAGDSISEGDTHQEVYTIKGGYSKQMDHFHFGVDAMYEGIAEHRSTNPKYSNYSYWLRLGLNAAWTKGKHIFSVRAYPELNQQSISANTFLNSTKFFQFYGFGLWNRRETVGSLSYARVQRIWGGGGDLLYLYNGDWKYSAQLIYNYRRLTTEEVNLKNLFSGNKHYLREQVSAFKTVGEHTFYTQLSAMQEFMSGKENVYENQSQSQEQNLFDYVLVGNNQFYHRKYMNADWKGKMVFNVAAQQAIHVLAGVGYAYRDETYDVPFIELKSSNILPTVAVGYQRHRDKYALECNLSATFQCNIDKSFDYATYTENVFTRAQAYVPHLLQTENNQQVKADILFSHVIGKKYELGIRSTFAHVHSDNRKDTYFTTGVNFMF